MDWKKYNMNDDLFLNFHYTDREILTLEDRLKDKGVTLVQFTNMLKEDVQRMLRSLKWNDWNMYVRTRGFVLSEKVFGYE